MDIPITNPALAAQLAKGFVAAAKTFKLLCELIFNEILATPSANTTKKKTMLFERLQGLFGTSIASCGVVEDQARGSPHMHIVFWGSLPPSLLQAVASEPTLVQKISRKLEEMCSATVDSISHLQNLLRNRSGEQSERPSLFPPHLPTVERKLHTNDCNRVAKNVEIHSNTFTCKQTAAGAKGCRLARLMETVQETTAFQIVPQINRGGTLDFEVLPSVEPRPIDNNSSLTQQLLQPDKRMIIYELVRPTIDLDLPQQMSSAAALSDHHYTLTCGNTIEIVPDHLAELIDQLTEEETRLLKEAIFKRNGMVVEHNPMITAMLGCNTNVSILGSAT